MTIGAPVSEVPSRSMRELVQVHGIEDLPAVGEVDPYLLGATNSAFGRSGQYGRRDSYVARTANRVDDRLAEALAGDRLVVVVGPSKAGKTRTLFEAIHAHDPDAKVVWPVPDDVGELVAHPRVNDSEDTLVVWLDDLHLYLTSANPLIPAVLARLFTRRGRTVVVATLRSEMRAQLRGGGELRPETRMLLEQAVTIDLASTIEDPDEQAAATRAYPGQVGDGHGLGEVLAGALELLARYDDARVADPPLHAVIATAVDWARVGRTDPIPEPVLIDLALGQLRSAHPYFDATAPSMRAAVTVARTPPAGAGRAAALHTTHLDDDDTRGYRAFDYLVAADDGQDHRPPRPIPGNYWHNATGDCDSTTLMKVGFAANRRSEKAIARIIFRKAADAGNTNAMAVLGALLAAEWGDWEEAETWLRKAAEAGNTHAMSMLGALLAERGDQEEAETWYRKAAEAGNTHAMSMLGALLAERGDQEEAETWYRKAADGQHTDAMAMLGALLAERGDWEEVETWYRKAADTGDTDAMTMLGALLAERGDQEEAETWYRKAADGQHTDAMAMLGALLAERGDWEEAETWYRKAADAGQAAAMVNLGVLLAERGDQEEAETWHRKGADAGQTDAMANLGVLLAEQGDQEEAETWLRKGAEAGNTHAMSMLGVLLAERGDQEEAETWHRKAADAGDTDAAANLGALLVEHKRSGLATGR